MGGGSKNKGVGGNFRRGLTKSELAGVIFGCTHQTFKECVTQLIFVDFQFLGEKMMEYQGPNQRVSGGLESLFGQSMVQNLPHQLTQELHEATGKMSIKPSDSIGPYPERPGVADCVYYSRTGSCVFGMNCRFNHPPNSKQKEGCGRQLQFNFMGLPIREGETQCPDYIRTGFCKYDFTCRFHHPEPASESGLVSSSALQMNRTNPLASSSENSYTHVHPSGNLPKSPYASSICMQEHTADMDATYPFPQDMAPMAVLSNNYQTPIKPSSFEGNQHPNGIGLMNVQTNTRSLIGARTISAIETGHFGIQSPATVTGRNTFPERPGQPECQHYLKTGNCKFAATCRFHHPRSNEQSGLRNFSLSSEGKQLSVGVDFENTIKNSNDLTTSTHGSVPSAFRPVSSSTMAFPVVQSQTSLIQKCKFPERPGQAECQYYMKTGDCKFGHACLFHHPKERLEQSSV